MHSSRHILQSKQHVAALPPLAEQQSLLEMFRCFCGTECTAEPKIDRLLRYDHHLLTKPRSMKAEQRAPR